MKLQLCVSIFFCVASCEWVEITPIQNKKYLSDPKKLFQTTTVNYESIMKSPFAKMEIATMSSLLDREILEREFDNDTIIEISDDMEASVPHSDDDFINDESSIDDSDEDDESNSEFEDNGGYTIENFLPFFKMIQNNLLNFRKLHNSKLSVLKNLRDNLVRNIKAMIPKIWKPTQSFEARGYYEEDTHMDFPSNEGALMTIGFLTFAVFLIKLVIKLIHTLKNKQQLNNMSTTTAASVVFLKRKKRDEREEEIAKILQYIDD